MIYPHLLMLTGGSCTLCMISGKFPELDLYSPGTNPAHHLRTAGIGPTVDDSYDLYNLYDLDRNLSELWQISMDSECSTAP